SSEIKAGSVVDLHFFFQAEDGIRDFHVTGVQTCALPISSQQPFSCSRPPAPWCPMMAAAAEWLLTCRSGDLVGMVRYVQRLAGQIGRASCRERVATWRRTESTKSNAVSSCARMTRKTASR